MIDLYCLEILLDSQVKEYVAAVRATGGAIVLAAAEGIILATDRSLLRQHGGSTILTESWAKSLLGYVKRKGSNSAKVSPAEFEKKKEQFLLDTKTEVIMTFRPV